MADFKLDSIEASASGLDAFFESDGQTIVTPFGEQPPAVQKIASGRKKVASLADLNGFTRASTDTLVHKSTQELWALRQNGEGFFIERLFTDNGAPLKG